MGLGREELTGTGEGVINMFKGVLLVFFHGRQCDPTLSLSPETCGESHTGMGIVL